MKMLTKSDYLLGLECPKYLWIKFNQPEKIRRETVADKFRLNEGNKVGELAKQLFQNGIDISHKDFKENIKKSKELLKEKKPLFEAGFEFNNCFSRADILVPAGNEWDIVEVKAATKTKDINIHDVSFQKYVYEGNGIKIGKCFILHLNKDYTRKGELNIKELFTKDDITEEASKLSKDIELRIKNIFNFVSGKNPPKAGIILKTIIKEGHHDCKIENCLELPENHVFCLYYGGKISCELYENGVELIKDIPENVKLNSKQTIQRECQQKNKIYADKKAIKEFLDKLKYPVHYLDFETFSTAVPLFNGLKCYSQVPFQFSLHIVEKEGAEPKHYEFLYSGNGDPRKDFITELRKVVSDKGTIVVYNQSFELNRLEELGDNFNEYKRWIKGVQNRTVDLLMPFREFAYYNPKQNGSASIKKVLPALTGKGYEGMEIADGGTASVEFFNMTYDDCSKEDKKRIREDLLKYCGLDTEAEIMIVDRLKEMLSK